MWAHLLVAALLAQGKLEFTGKPLLIPFSCSEQEILELGLSCTSDEPCAVYLELAQLETAGLRIFVTGNLHTETTTLQSILLSSDDGGKTWIEAHPRLRAAGLDHIQFIDYERGWVAGQVLQTLPRDPFFLLTTDGGKTWNRRPIFDDARLGTIEQFVFTSARDGEMLVDRTRSGEPEARYHLYESRTGGESWSLREVSSKPPALRKSRPVNTDWRLRADAASRSYRVEKREAGKWTLLASFQVRLNDCKPPEVKLAEPPPLPEEPAEAKPVPIPKKKK